MNTMQQAPFDMPSGKHPSEKKRRVSVNEQLKLLDRIRHAMPGLSVQFQAVARFCLVNATTMYRMRILDASSASGILPATFVRFAKQFGFSGFTDLKLALLEQAEGTAAVAVPLTSAMQSDALALHRASNILIVSNYPVSPMTWYLEFAFKCLGKRVHVCIDVGGAGSALPSLSEYDLVFDSRFAGSEQTEWMRHANSIGLPVVWVDASQTGEGTQDSVHLSEHGIPSLRNLNRSMEIAHLLIRDLEMRARH